MKFEVVRQLFEKMRLPISAADNSGSASAAAESRQQSCTDWSSTMLPVCFGAAIAIAVVSVQYRSRTTMEELPTTFHLVSLGVLIASAFFYVSKFMGPKFGAAAEVLERVGVFFMATSLFMAITVPFPLWLRVVTWVVYVISLLVVLVSNLL
ncbi:hypothetical protein PanWU01x14_210450 [Parasponia andersonii]|uniref:Transmembrane protein n=1 Tax=Parasponia andersonii TaxID=3476 RepID=A0A2P5BTT6_PARAD|nr:hypothetical protein PanWU01x14_210450 [Parasponia andersonii]